MRRPRRHVLPGFGLSLGFTVTYLCLLVLLPLSGVALTARGISWAEFVAAVTSERALAAFGLSVGAAVTAALVNAVFGLLVAWVLVRYRFPGRRLVDACVDLPFALPTSVAGIALTAVYSPTGWLGQPLAPLGHPGRVHAARRGRRADLHRPAVRRARRAAGARGPRPRGRGGGRQPRREPLADVPPRAAAVDRARARSPGSRWPSRARSASTARSCSSRGTCRCAPRSSRC